MINENNELIITTSEALDVIKIVNKLQMKETISKGIADYIELNKKKEEAFIKLRKLLIAKVGEEEYIAMDEEDKKIASENMLMVNEDIKAEIINANTTLAKIGTDLVYEFIMRLPLAEREIYKCLSKIFNKSLKEIETQSLDITIEQIKAISNSKTVIGFFNLATR